MVRYGIDVANEPQAPALPVEVVSLILGYVQRDTVLAALKVDWTWHSAALPRLYEHLWFDPKGPRPGEIRTEYLSKVRVLDVYNHGPGDCAGMDFKTSPEVIRLHFRFTLGLIVNGHGGKKCPMFDLKPDTAVFLDFNGLRFVRRENDPFQLYPHARERILVWDIATGVNLKGFFEQSDMIFSCSDDDWGVTELVEELEAGNPHVKPEVQDQAETVIFSNKSSTQIDDYPELFEFFLDWLTFPTARRHIAVNFEAFNPGCRYSALCLADKMFDLCDDLGMDIVPYQDNGTPKYPRLLPGNWTDTFELWQYGDSLARYLTAKEIKGLLPANRDELRPPPFVLGKPAKDPEGA